MIKELLSIFRADNPMQAVSKNVTQMMTLALETTQTAGRIYFERQHSETDRAAIYDTDVRINKLERAIRKQLITHLSLPGNTADVPYALLTMNVVKDVERLGDYAKNLGELVDIHTAPWPDDPIIEALRAVRREVEDAFSETASVLQRSDHARALAMLRSGRDIANRCEEIIAQVAASDYAASAAVAAALGARYYKRFDKHLMNIISCVVMPLHKIDYFDPDDITITERPVAGGSR